MGSLVDNERDDPLGLPTGKLVVELPSGGMSPEKQGSEFQFGVLGLRRHDLQGLQECFAAAHPGPAVVPRYAILAAAAFHETTQQGKPVTTGEVRPGGIVHRVPSVAFVSRYKNDDPFDRDDVLGIPTTESRHAEIVASRDFVVHGACVGQPRRPDKDQAESKTKQAMSSGSAPHTTSWAIDGFYASLPLSSQGMGGELAASTSNEENDGTGFQYHII